MAWTLDYNTGGAGLPERFVWFNNTLFAFVYDASGGAGGVWRRDGNGNWTKTISGCRAFLWDDDNAIYIGKFAPDRREIWRSTDGTNWVLDWTLPVGWQGSTSNFFGIGGYSSYLYAVSYDVTGAGTAYFYRRDLLGNWTQHSSYSPVGTGAVNTKGVIGFGSYVYWSEGLNFRRWTGATWQDVPGFGSTKYITNARFTIHNNTLYARGYTSAAVYRYYYKTLTGSWTEDDPGLPDNSWGLGTAGIGSDGKLYAAAGDGANGKTWVKNGSWATFHDVTGVDPFGIGILPTSVAYIGQNAAAFYRFEPVVAYTPSGNGLSDRAMDVDGNGDTLYLGLYDASTNPELITVPLPLNGTTSNGTSRYAPGAGDAINVKTHYEVGDFSIIAGHFGNNEQVRRSVDGGPTYSDIDPGIWAANKAQPIAIDPNDEEHVLLALDALDDLVEKDSNDAWTTLDAALPFDVGAMAIYDLDPNEIVIGRINAGAVMIQYSPNNASTWQDITGALPITDGIASLELV